MPAARSQEVTVRRPAARTAPRKRRMRRGAERASSRSASWENHWHGVGVDAHNAMAGPSVVRGGMSTAIVPEGPALVYSATPRGANRENRGKCRPNQSRRIVLAADSRLLAGVFVAAWTHSFGPDAHPGLTGRRLPCHFGERGSTISRNHKPNGQG